MPVLDKAPILAALKEFWSQGQTGGSEFGSFTTPLTSTPLVGLVPFVRDRHIVYQRSDSGEEFLGLGVLYQHHSPEERAQTSAHLKLNPKLKVFFAARFESTGIKAPEWASFGSEIGIIPLIQWHSLGSKSELQINFSWASVECEHTCAELLFKIDELLDFAGGEVRESKFKAPTEVPDQKKWCHSIDDIALKLAHQVFPGEVDKVVMARKRVLRASELVGPQAIFARMSESYSSGYIFFMKVDHHRAFLSFTPERLFSYNGSDIEVDVIAGTRPRGQSVDEDQAFAEDLMNSPKELEEHRIVATEIERKLKSLCQEVRATSREELLKLSHVQHIKGTYQARGKNLSPFTIMDHLHPTPAVGGRPWPAALAIIKQYERFDRGLYAGPCGVISESFTDIMVGIRSLVIYQDEVHIFGGAGIVAGSKGTNEWIETDNKMKNFNLHLG